MEKKRRIIICIFFGIFIISLISIVGSERRVENKSSLITNLCTENDPYGENCGKLINEIEKQELKNEISRKKLLIKSENKITWMNNNKSIVKAGIFDVKDKSKEYYIMQLYSPLRGLSSSLDERTRNEILDLVEILDATDKNAFFVKLKNKNFKKIKNLILNKKIAYFGEIPSSTKIDPNLLEKMNKNKSKEYEIVVRFFEKDKTNTDIVKKFLKNISYEGEDTIAGFGNADSVKKISELDFIKYIRQVYEKKLFNLEGGMAVASDINYYYGYTGSGIKVTVGDTGLRFDDSFDKPHPDFAASRIIDAWGCRSSLGCKEWDLDYVNDGDGHGTHISGILGGSGQASNGRYRGVAPETKLLIHQICEVSNGANALELSLKRSGQKNSNIYSTSAGQGQAGVYGKYGDGAKIIDKAVRGDYGSKIPIVTAAGNQHCKHYNTIENFWATAKNAIAVGVVKDGYPFDHKSYRCKEGYEDVCESSSVMCEEDNWPPGKISCASSCGYVDTDDDGYVRVKPDIVAPGLITTSASYLFYHDGPCWEAYKGMDSGIKTCDYEEHGGTSMAQPVVAGLIALFLQAYPQYKNSPEVVKAQLINTAVLLGEDFLVDNKYGHGLVDGYHMIYNDDSFKTLKLVEDILSEDTPKEYEFTVPQGAKKLKITITWSDPPGKKEVVNEMSYELTYPDGDKYSKSCWDDNVLTYYQQFYLEPGTYKIKLSLDASVWHPTQTFGMAIGVIMKDPSLTLNSYSNKETVVGDSEFTITTELSNEGYTAAGSYISLFEKNGFEVKSVLLTRRDGRKFFYNTTWMKKNPLSVPVGEIVMGHLRKVEWILKPNPSQLSDGDYTFKTMGVARNYGQYNKYITIHYKKEVECSCTSWIRGSCGGGSCTDSERQYTRTCTPSGCDVEEKCEYDSSCTHGITRYVCKSGCQYDNIEDAIESSNRLDRVVITDKGTYYENQIRWPEADAVILNCQGATLDGQNTDHEAIKIRSENTKIEEPIIKNCNFQNYRYGLLIEAKDNYIPYGKIENNSFRNNYVGVYIEGNVDGAKIRNNIFNSNERGIQMEKYGKHQRPYENEISYNIFSGNKDIAIYFYDTWVGENEIFSNMIKDNQGYGIYIESNGYVSETYIKNNLISNNSYGLYIKNAENNIIHNNTFCSPNVNYDLLISGSGNSGTGNTCDKPGSWNDAGTVGCTYTCCSDECSEGEKICLGAYSQTCGDYDDDPCLEWPSSTEGEGNEYCGDDYCENWGENYCKDDDVYHNRTCHDRGCSGGSCYDNTYEEEQLVNICPCGCENGTCVTSSADINYDFKVDIFDLAKVGLCYGCMEEQECWTSEDCYKADLSGNGKVDIFDLATVGLNYGREC